MSKGTFRRQLSIEEQISIVKALAAFESVPVNVRDVARLQFLLYLKAGGIADGPEVNSPDYRNPLVMIFHLAGEDPAKPARKRRTEMITRLLQELEEIRELYLTRTVALFKAKHVRETAQELDDPGLFAAGRPAGR